MRLLFVVQRYGEEVAGGAERFARDIATRLAGRGHEIEVLTSCARDYMTWADHYAAGTSRLDGVTLHRLPVVQPRDSGRFDPLNERVLRARGTMPLHLQESWMTLQGPRLDGFEPWLTAAAPSYDAAVFFTYLYLTTHAGIPITSPSTTTILHPTAHDEPPLHLPIHQTTFRIPDGFGFLTEEERVLVKSTFGVRRPFATTGMGIDVDVHGDADRFRERARLRDRPYLLYMGRIDPNKGAVELYEQFVAYKARNPGPLALAMAGEPVVPLDAHPDVVFPGFVSEQEKHDAYAGCLAFVSPSYFESFSIVLAEAWAHGRPALVQGRGAVVNGQARRSGGGIPYTGFAEFEAAVDLLVDDPSLGDQLGRRGADFVRREYAWDQVMTRYERFVESLVATRRRRRTGAAV